MTIWKVDWRVGCGVVRMSRSIAQFRKASADRTKGVVMDAGPWKQESFYFGGKGSGGTSDAVCLSAPFY